MVNSYYKSDFRSGVTDGHIPTISTDIDSVRAFQFEVHFTGIPGGAEPRDLTLAAKKVSAVTMTSEDIVVDRVNDKTYYPGKVTPEEVTVTFDNIYLKDTDKKLWDLFTQTYDPMTGALGDAQDIKIGKVEVVLLDNKLDPHSVLSMHGAYAKKYALSELQYSENQFNTIEVNFRFDYLDVASA
tara:strand:+ start:265 stop:816 length:552 start_codon:yes stop_codon:yes gene_type:complete